MMVSRPAFFPVLFYESYCFSGISGKSQILFAITYIARYLDLFTTFVSLYNTTMKLIFISASLATLYLMYVKFRATYDSNHDSFRIEFLLIPTAILALIINHEFSVVEVSLCGSQQGRINLELSQQKKFIFRFNQKLRRT